MLPLCLREYFTAQFFWADDVKPILREVHGVGTFAEAEAIMWEGIQVRPALQHPRPACISVPMPYLLLVSSAERRSTCPRLLDFEWPAKRHVQACAMLLIVEMCLFFRA